MNPKSDPTDSPCRRRSDRRKRPTPFPLYGGLFTPARRTTLRRDEEAAQGGYVDRVSSTVGMAVLALLVLSAVDAALTLKHIEYGGSELVPTMEWALTVSPEFFVGLKMFLTAMGGILLAALEYYPASRPFLPTALGAYILLMAYHCLLILTEW